MPQTQRILLFEPDDRLRKSLTLHIPRVLRVPEKERPEIHALADDRDALRTFVTRGPHACAIIAVGGDARRGIALIRTIRSNAPALLIAVTTGPDHLAAEAEALATELGLTFIRKPFSSDQLMPFLALALNAGP